MHNSVDSLDMLCTAFLHNRGFRYLPVETLSVQPIDADLASLVRLSNCEEVQSQLYFLAPPRI